MRGVFNFAPPLGILGPMADALFPTRYIGSFLIEPHRASSRRHRPHAPSSPASSHPSLINSSTHQLINVIERHRAIKAAAESDDWKRYLTGV